VSARVLALTVPLWHSAAKDPCDHRRAVTDPEAPMRSLTLAALVVLTALPAIAQDTGKPPAQTSPTQTPPAQTLPAETPMTGEAFDAYTRGRTLSYALQGTPYGIEQYLPDHRVRWAFVDDQCRDGTWFERAGNICFVYENAPTSEQCWNFYQTADGLRGVFQGPDGPGTELYEVQDSPVPLTCQGPGVGV